MDNSPQCKNCLLVFNQVYTNKSHKFLGLCKPFLLQDRQGKRKNYDLNVKAKVNDKIINLVNENDSPLNIAADITAEYGK